MLLHQLRCYSGGCWYIIENSLAYTIIYGLLKQPLISYRKNESANLTVIFIHQSVNFSPMFEIGFWLGVVWPKLNIYVAWTRLISMPILHFLQMILALMQWPSNRKTELDEL